MLRITANRLIRMSSPEFRLTLTVRAQRDMFHILKYSVEMWGEAQARIYQSKLLNAYDLILDNPLIGKVLGGLTDERRIFSVGSHVVIYRVRGKIISVIRILHQNMSPGKWL
jgi:toxin ParE1/3/4